MKNREKRAHLTRKNGDRAPHFPRNERESAPAARSEAEKKVNGEGTEKSVQCKKRGGGRCRGRAAGAFALPCIPRESSEVLPSAVPSREAEKGGRKALPSPFGIIPYLSAEIRTPSENQTMPCAIIASATLRNPAMFAPATKLPFIPYFSHASETFL